MINIEIVKTITEKKSAYSLLLLKDKRIASCSTDNTIRIYDPSNDYHCDQEIKRHNSEINSICELDEGTIVSCSEREIMIGDYKMKYAHDNTIYKVITLRNNWIASRTDDYTIQIWKSNPPYSNTPIKVLRGHNETVDNILYIKKRDMMISGSNDYTLRLWNMSTYQCETVFERIQKKWFNNLFQIDEDRVITGKMYTIYIFNIDKCVIEKKIEDKSFWYVSRFLKLRDNHTILCGSEDGVFSFYDMNTGEYKQLRRFIII